MATQMKKTLVLRGYIEQTGDNEYFAICLTLNLVTRGRTLQEIQTNLSEAICFYIEDAIKNNEVNEFIPRHAPASYWFTYYKYTLLYHFTAPIRFIRLWKDYERLDKVCA